MASVGPVADEVVTNMLSTLSLTDKENDAAGNIANMTGSQRVCDRIHWMVRYR